MQNTHTRHFLYWLTLIATVFALTVVILGAYTRLKEAGLGCPDWPGCYGHWLAPSHAEKAWTEMIHRYAAGFLGILIFIIFFLTFRMRHFRKDLFGLSVLLCLLVIFQAALGMWTVTLRLLPIVVMGHLLGGMTIAALLWSLHRLLHPIILEKNVRKKFQSLAVIGLILLILQIALGGWVSSNYAALVCPDFPTCQGHLWPPMNFYQAFNIFSSIGPNYQGGILTNTPRVTIHMMHRVGALIITIYVGYLSLALLCNKINLLKRIGGCLLILLITQITLGILNVKWLLPLPIAVAHNAVALLLLLTLVTLVVSVFVKSKENF